MTNTITTEKLCDLTGLTDRRLRQLSQQGHFPPKTETGWLTEDTLAGLVKHYQAQAKKQNDGLKRQQEALAKARTKKVLKEVESMDGQTRIDVQQFAKALIGINTANQGSLRAIVISETCGRLGPKLPEDLYKLVRAELEDACARYWREWNNRFLSLVAWSVCKTETGKPDPKAEKKFVQDCMGLADQGEPEPVFFSAESELRRLETQHRYRLMHPEAELHPSSGPDQRFWPYKEVQYFRQRRAIQKQQHDKERAQKNLLPLPDNTPPPDEGLKDPVDQQHDKERAQKNLPPVPDNPIDCLACKGTGMLPLEGGRGGFKAGSKCETCGGSGIIDKKYPFQP